MPKCVVLRTSPKAIKYKLNKVDFGNLISKYESYYTLYDVKHDALLNFDDMGFFGNMCTGSNLQL